MSRHIEGTGKPNQKPRFGLSAAVGPSCPNRKRDVMIVQWLLYRYFEAQDFSSAPDEDYDLRVNIDGIMGPKTAKAIVTFQKMNPLGCPYLDGKVDKDQFTIAWLEYQYSQNYPEYYYEPAKDPECPKELADSFDPTVAIGKAVGEAVLSGVGETVGAVSGLIPGGSN
jgi:peptidoglycan hydrolase-like protein with peptidoglycan-binding domain